MWHEEELTDEELARQRRRTLIRSAIVIAVVVAMVATLVVPVIVRVVRTPREPEPIVTTPGPMASDRMIV